MSTQVRAGEVPRDSKFHEPPGGTRARRQADDSTEVLRRLGHILDASIPLPGGYRIGWDSIIGLVPGVGDLVSASLSSYIVVSAARMGVPRVVLARMIVNVGIDMLIGAIPVLGDIFDAIFKANLRNIRLLERYQAAPAATRKRTGWSLLGVALVVIAVFVVLFMAAIGLILAIVALFN